MASEILLSHKIFVYVNTCAELNFIMPNILWKQILQIYIMLMNGMYENISIVISFCERFIIKKIHDGFIVLLGF